jgi:hypothetical protein
MILTYRPSRPSHPNPNGAPSTTSTHGDGSSTTKSQYGQSSISISSRRPLTTDSRRTETPPSQTDSHQMIDNSDRGSHAEGDRRHSKPSAPGGPTAPRTSKSPFLPMPKTPSPHKAHPYSVERFVRDLDSRERARMGLMSVAQEGRQVASSGRGRGTRPPLGIETEMAGLGLGERRNSAGRL